MAGSSLRFLWDVARGAGRPAATGTREDRPERKTVYPERWTGRGCELFFCNFSGMEPYKTTMSLLTLNGGLYT